MSGAPLPSVPPFVTAFSAKCCPPDRRVRFASALSSLLESLPPGDYPPPVPIEGRRRELLEEMMAALTEWRPEQMPPTVLYARAETGVQILGGPDYVMKFSTEDSFTTLMEALLQFRVYTECDRSAPEVLEVGILRGIPGYPGIPGIRMEKCRTDVYRMITASMGAAAAPPLLRTLRPILEEVKHILRVKCSGRLLHGDCHMTNVMTGSDGRLLLMDFGRSVLDCRLYTNEMLREPFDLLTIEVSMLHTLQSIVYPVLTAIADPARRVEKTRQVDECIAFLTATISPAYLEYMGPRPHVHNTYELHETVAGRRKELWMQLLSQYMVRAPFGLQEMPPEEQPLVFEERDPPAPLLMDLLAGPAQADPEGEAFRESLRVVEERERERVASSGHGAFVVSLPPPLDPESAAAAEAHAAATGFYVGTGAPPRRGQRSRRARSRKRSRKGSKGNKGSRRYR